VERHEEPAARELQAARVARAHKGAVFAVTVDGSADVARRRPGRAVVSRRRVIHVSIISGKNEVNRARRAVLDGARVADRDPAFFSVHDLRRGPREALVARPPQL